MSAEINSVKGSEQSFLELVPVEEIIIAIFHCIGRYINSLEITKEDKNQNGDYTNHRKSSIPGLAIVEGIVSNKGVSRHIHELSSMNGLSVSTYSDKNHDTGNYGVSVDLTNEHSKINLLNVNPKEVDIFAGIVKRVRIAMTFFNQEAILMAITREDFSRILHISQNVPLDLSAEDIEAVAYLATKLEAAKAIKPMSIGSEDANQYSKETIIEAVVISHMSHIFYTVAHWCMQDISNRMQNFSS